MRIPRSNFSIAPSDRFAASADMREPVSPHQEMQSPNMSVAERHEQTGHQQTEHNALEPVAAEDVSVAPLSYAPAVVTEVASAPSPAAHLSVIPSHPLRSKHMSNNFAVKHWMDQDRAVKAEQQAAVATPAAQAEITTSVAAPVVTSIPVAPVSPSAPVNPKPANPSMIVTSPHVAYQGMSVREQFGSGEKVWKNAFALAENVRFTRTPENELMRLRAKLIEEFGAEEEVEHVARQITSAAPAVKEPAPVVAEQVVQSAKGHNLVSVQAQPVRTTPMLRGPSSVIVAARLRLPVVPIAPHVEAVAPLAGAVISPVVSVVPAAEVVNAVVSHLPQTLQSTVAEAKTVSQPEQGGLQLSHLSDFAFWEFAGLPEMAVPATQPVVAAIAPVIANVQAVAEPVAQAPVLAPLPEKSILSMFRTVEWRPAHEEAATAALPDVTQELAAEPEVQEPEFVAEPVVEAVTPAQSPVITTAVSNPFLPSFSFGLSGYQMPSYAFNALAPVSAAPVTAPVIAEPVAAVAEESFVPFFAASEAAVPAAISPAIEATAEVTTVAASVEEPASVAPAPLAPAPLAPTPTAPTPTAMSPLVAPAHVAAPRSPSSSINLSIFSPTAIETGTVMSSIGYEYPPRDLLQEPVYKDGAIISQEMLQRSAGLLESILEDFGVRGEIIHVRPGPVVTLYEFEPAPGVKSSRVIGLADDIARSMSALSARVAVVPGRNVIGIELPNAIRETVYFRELIESPAFEGTSHRLALCLGKTIGGEPVVAELAKMPHLLVAGTTGSGKSVAINTMILSLLYRLKPEECRLIMIDPKMLELSIYDGIPHLLTPVVTDPKKAVVALKWTVREMEERYRKMSRLGVRNIDGYNARAAAAREKGETVTCTVQAGFDKATGEILYEEQEMDLTPMPYIVVIVDEMADLMMVAGKEIEGAIQRLAQMARAAGIHLIMATQRPSVDVITGTIKANFPTRISFQVTSKIDSRTILGEQGAEQLLGQGDMLHMAGGGRIVRVHGPFVSDEEVEKVVNHLKEQGRPDYLSTVTADEDDTDVVEEDSAVFDKSDMASEDGDDMFEKAIKVVMRDKKCSTSYIQRRLSIGYNRAASLVERMEQEGLVGPANHVGKREIIGQDDGM